MILFYIHYYREMNLKEVFEIAAKTGDFPTVEVSNPIPGHPNTKGKIVQIKPSGVSVDLGAGWNAWFWARDQQDKRCKQMSELKPT